MNSPNPRFWNSHALPRGFFPVSEVSYKCMHCVEVASPWGQDNREVELIGDTPNPPILPAWVNKCPLLFFNCIHQSEDHIPCGVTPSSLLRVEEEASCQRPPVKLLAANPQVPVEGSSSRVHKISANPNFLTFMPSNSNISSFIVFINTSYSPVLQITLIVISHRRQAGSCLQSPTKVNGQKMWRGCSLAGCGVGP